MIALLFDQYFYLRQRIPIILYVFYIHYKDSDNPIIKKIVNLGLAFIGASFMYAFTGLMLKIPFSILIPFKWCYQGIITWCIFFFVYYYISTQKGINELGSFTLATLATVGCGWLYEVSFFYPTSMFLTRSSIFYLNGQIICLLLLAYELKKMKFRPNKFIYITMIILIIFSIMLFCTKSKLFIDWTWLVNYLWFYRIPASLFLLSLLSGVKRNYES